MTLRLGFFLYAPRVGGAERYVKDLLRGVDRGSFEPVLLYAQWPALDAYLDVDELGVEARTLPLRELGVGKLGEEVGPPDEAPHGAEIPPSTLRRISRALPMLERLAPTAKAAARGVYFWRNLSRLERALRDARVDVLHVVNGGYPGATSAQAAAAVAHSAGVAVCVMTVASTPVPRRFPRAVERHIDDRVGAGVDAVIVAGRRPFDSLVARRDFPAEKIRIVPWGVNDPGEAPIGVTMPGGVRVGTLANFTGAKGHGLLLEAFARLSAMYPTLRLSLGGDGPDRSRLQAEVERRGLGQRVDLPGAVVDARAFIRDLDVFVLASDIEGLPYVVLEAMSESCAVIATDVGALGEAIENGVSGILIEPRDVSALTAAVEQLVNDEPLRLALGQEARATFDERFSVARMLDAHEALYRELYRARR